MTNKQIVISQVSNGYIVTFREVGKKEGHYIHTNVEDALQLCHEFLDGSFELEVEFSPYNGTISGSNPLIQ